MDGISLHYYTVPHDWSHKGAATGFDKDEYYLTINKMEFTDELIQKHTTIMDKYDPKKRVGLIFDEWGTWYDVEPGTNPGFLYQQNTMRDAIVAGTTLNIFNKHSDRIRMANIAQLVNVLQCVILTEGKKMVKTPTYYVFKMYADHQDATLVQSSVEKQTIGPEKTQIHDIFESVSKTEDGRLIITVTNQSVDDPRTIDAVITDYDFSKVEGSIITADMGAYNDFDKKEEVFIKDFNDFKKTEKGISFTLPACSVVKLVLSK